VFLPDYTVTVKLGNTFPPTTTEQQSCKFGIHCHRSNFKK